MPPAQCPYHSKEMENQTDNLHLFAPFPARNLLKWCQADRFHGESTIDDVGAAALVRSEALVSLFGHNRLEEVS
jgi:hypothetical protein